MKAVVFHGIGDIRVDEVDDPKILDPNDVIVRLSRSAICGTDLHMVRGSMTGMKAGTVLGHEGVGVVEAVGSNVRNIRPDDRVVIPSTIACGYCSYCRAGYQSQCDNANPHGPLAGTAFFGGPEQSGPFDGCQAEYVRVPYGNVGLVKIPEGVSDDQAILLSDIFPTGYFAAILAEITPGDTVAVLGCGPVGQFAIASAWLLGAGRVIAIDTVPFRLGMATEQGAEAIDFNVEDPVRAVRDLTGGIGVDRVIDAVGVDAFRPFAGPAKQEADRQAKDFEMEVARVAPESHPQGNLWRPGNAPSQALQWAARMVAKAGTIGIVGVYPPAMKSFPVGEAMNRNLTIRAGNCHHRRYIPELLEYVKSGQVDPLEVLTQVEPFADVLEAYKTFDQREPGWVKVALRV